MPTFLGLNDILNRVARELTVLFVVVLITYLMAFIVIIVLGGKLAGMQRLQWPEAIGTKSVQMLCSYTSLLRDPALGDERFAIYVNQCSTQMFNPSPNYFLNGSRMPDFIVAGFQKSGTSSIVESLRSHSQISIRRSEIRYFDKHFERGPKWYSTKLRASQKATNVLIGDKSNDYIFYPLFPQRLSSLIPQVKVILILRDPIARAFSEYRWCFCSVLLSASNPMLK